MNKSILSLHAITKTFKQGNLYVPVLKGIETAFHQGTLYAITGASGAGKSTFLHCVAGLETPTTGSVCFNGKDLHSMAHKEKEQFFNKDLGLIFQLPYLINELTVVENVMLKGTIQGMNVQECRTKATLLLEQLGLKEKASCFPQTLSGGQQQRVAIARALLNQPTFLLADEPTGNLDEQTGRILIDLLISYQQRYGMGLIISSHDPYVVQKMDLILSLKDGFLVQDIKEPEHGKRNSIYA
jgi:ABC-type lipoprotein export system ATPase subunit